jgi:hypothetical protein
MCAASCCCCLPGQWWCRRHACTPRPSPPWHCAPRRCAASLSSSVCAQRHTGRALLGATGSHLYQHSVPTPGTFTRRCGWSCVTQGAHVWHSQCASRRVLFASVHAEAAMRNLRWLRVGLVRYVQSLHTTASAGLLEGCALSKSLSEGRLHEGTLLQGMLRAQHAALQGLVCCSWGWWPGVCDWRAAMSVRLGRRHAMGHAMGRRGRAVHCHRCGAIAAGMASCQLQCASCRTCFVSVKRARTVSLQAPAVPCCSSQQRPYQFQLVWMLRCELALQQAQAAGCCAREA